jgi:nitroreductase
MDFYEAVRRRRMVRSFTDEPVAPEIVERILDAARRGPSAGYSQGVEFVVVTDEATRHAIAAPGEEVLKKSGHKNFVAQAPVHIAICCNPEMYKSRYREPDKMRVVAGVSEEAVWRVPYWYTDAGCAMMLILLAAVNEGVAAAFVGGAGGRVREILRMPSDYVCVGLALLGHEAPDARRYGDISADARPRRPLAEVVHHERW